MAQQALSCVTGLDCPARFKCYASSDLTAGNECYCNKSMLFSGPDCSQVSILAVFTFSAILILMLRCTVHSYCVFGMLSKKWLKKRNLPPQHGALSLIAALWISCSASLFTIVCIFNAIRMFTVAHEGLIFTRLVPTFFASAGLLATLAANLTGLFWAEVALKQRGSGRIVISFKIYQSSSMVLSFVLLGIFAVLNLLHGPGVSSLILLVVPLILMFMVCFIGACLITKELHKLQESNPSIERILGNIQVAAFKILFHLALMTFIAAGYAACEAQQKEAVPAIVSHLLLIAFYMNISPFLYAIDEYLAFMKVNPIPCLFLGVALRLLCAGCLCHQGRKNRSAVIPVEEGCGEGDPQIRTKMLQRRMQRKVVLSFVGIPSSLPLRSTRDMRDRPPMS